MTTSNRFMRQCLDRRLSDPDEGDARPELEDPSDVSDPDDGDARPELEDPSGEDARPDLEDPGTVYTATDLHTERCEVRRVARRRARRECHSGFVIVRLTDKIARRDEKCPKPRKIKGKPPGPKPFPRFWDKFPALCKKPRKPGPGPEDEWQDPVLECLKELVADCPPRRLVGYLPPGSLRLLEALAAGPLAPLHSLAAYWRIDARHLPERLVTEIVRLLNEFVEVDLAYRELAALDPQQRPDFTAEQQHRRRAPLGVDASWIWEQVGTSQAASGVTVVDLEQGWFSHADLGNQALDLIHGVNRDEEDDYEGDHGTAVLGVLAAAADGRGVTGIAPGIDVRQVSHYQRDGRPADPSNGHVADAVVAAIVELLFDDDDAGRLRGGSSTAAQRERLRRREGMKPGGDLLLIEVQRSYKPTETDHADFDALRLASALGVIVVEAAGNDGADLDAYRDERGRRIFDRRGAGFRDSGAILVGAAESAMPHERWRSSNHGSRVDAYGLGDHVVTCAYGDLYDAGRAESYTGTFGGTSSAAPIVAGAAALLQWLHEQKAGVRLAPAEMREILADPETGTPQGRGRRGHIGVMPDLRAITRVLGLLPPGEPSAFVLLSVPDGSNREPPPAPPGFDWRAFLAFQRRHRPRRTLVRAPKGTAKAPLELPFVVTGTPDSPRTFEFEILAREPPAKLHLEVPFALQARLARARLWPRRVVGGKVRFRLPARPHLSLPPLRLAGGDHGGYPCAFLVTGAAAGDRITLRQLWKGVVVAELTWELQGDGNSAG